MSASEQQQEVAAIAVHGPAEAGAMLAAARAAFNMSIEEAAGKLRLSVHQLRALEAGDSASLPDATFVRGFIRNYARLLHIDAEPLLQAYRGGEPVAHHSITLVSENIPIAGSGKKSWQPFALAALLIVLALVGWMLFFGYGLPLQPQPEQPKPEVEQQAPLPAEVPPPEVVPAPEPVVEVAPVPAPPALGRLKATFNGAVWMRVVDGSGKEIYKKTRTAGSEEIIEGVPPLQVVVGNVAETRLTYNDQPVDLASHASANVARLTLE